MRTTESFEGSCDVEWAWMRWMKWMYKKKRGNSKWNFLWNLNSISSPPANELAISTLRKEKRERKKFRVRTKNDKDSLWHGKAEQGQRRRGKLFAVTQISNERNNWWYNFKRYSFRGGVCGRRKHRNVYLNFFSIFPSLFCTTDIKSNSML